MSRARGPQRCRAAVLAAGLALACCTPAGTPESATGPRPQAASPGALSPAAARPAATAAADGRPLSALFAALNAVESGLNSQPVTIIQFGDSHTAGDVFSGRLRERFQSRFGAAGRGMLPPGEPFPYFRPAMVSVSQTGGWRVANSHAANAGGLFGLTGFRVTGSGPNDLMTLESSESEGFALVSLGVLRQPGGGTLDIVVDGDQVHQLPTAGDLIQAARFDMPVRSGSRRVELRPRGNGPVEVMSWTVQRNGPGVILDSHGIVGATINVMANWEPATVAWELANRDPALIILAYGTNEGFQDPVTRDGYTAEFTERLAFIERSVPGASILVVGPPDAQRLPPGCRNGARPRAYNTFDCAPLSQSERARYAELFSRPTAASCRWHAPPNLDVVREVQRGVTAARGHYFWDWSQVMGTPCGTHAWALADPPLAFEDHVHLKQDGYVASADALFDELMSLYAVHRAAGRSGSAASPR